MVAVAATIIYDMIKIMKIIYDYVNNSSIRKK
jgi:hypothetical protein